jgi:hypothetical protein
MPASKSMSQRRGEPKPTLNSLYDSFGGYQNFLLSYGLKPYNPDDVEEGNVIAQTLLKPRLEDWESMKARPEVIEPASSTTTSKSTSQSSGKPKPTLKSIYDSFGGRYKFLISYGLKPHNADDVEEGERIARTMLEDDLEGWEESRKAEAVEAANTTTSQNSGKPKPTLKSIYDCYGGRDGFLISYGLKPYNPDDVEEGERIAQIMLEDDRDDCDSDENMTQNSGKPKRSVDSIYDSFGGEQNFLLSYGLKPWDFDDLEEGNRIIEAMLEHDSGRTGA